MLFYAVGSLLFAFAFMAAFAVIASSFRTHGAQMRAALRGLSLDSAYALADTVSADKTKVKSVNDRSRDWLAA